MASGATFHAKITADAREFIAQVEGAQEALKGLIQETKGAGKAGKSGAASKTSKAKKEQQSAQQDAMRAGDAQHQKEMQNIRKETEERKQGGAAAILAENRLRKKYSADQTKDLQKRIRESRQLAEAERTVLRDRQFDTGFQRAAGPLRPGAQGLKDLRVLQGDYNRQKQKQAGHEREIAAINRQQLDAMVTGRYALYDMANAYQQIAYHAFRVAQAVGFAVANTAKFESAFTTLERAAFLDEGTRNFQNMRDALVELSTEIPVAFDQISEIATLGAQMGVAVTDLQGFTKTVASFAAVTGASIDETAERFGRISALANVPVEEFENLASSVLFAGFNAVATEQEILSMSESIAAAAANAGYSADQVVGLATALSSLGIAPEQARGVILRVFNTITRAIEGSTDKLDAFAQAAGMSAEQAQYLWKESPEEFFTSLLNGLSSVEELTLALDELGITNTREINVIQRLSGNMDVYAQSLDEASRAYKEGTALQDIYSKTADNLETKITQLQNAFTALQDSAGQATAEVLKPVVDFLTQLARAATEFAKSGVGQAILPLVGTVAGLTAAFAGMQFISKLATAQLLAMRVAVLKMGQIGAGATNVFSGLKNAITGNLYVTDALSGRTQFLTKQTILAAMASGNLDKALGKQILASNRATLATRLLSASMSVLGIAMGAATIIGIGAMAYQMNKMQSAFGANIGGARSLAEAIGQDTAAYQKLTDAQKATTDEFITHTIEVEKNTESLNPNARAIQAVTGASEDFLTQNKIVTEGLEEQTLAIGANTREWIANALIQDENLEKALKKYPDFFGRVTDAGYDFAEMLDQILANPDIDFGEQIFSDIEQVGKGIQQVEDEILGIFGRAAGRATTEEENTRLSVLNEQKNSLEEQADVLQALKAAWSSVGPTIKDALNKTIFADAINGLLGIGSAADEAEEDIKKLDDGVGDLAKTLRTVIDYANDLDGIFGRVIDLEFAKIVGRDEIADGWKKIADNADKAADAIQKAAQTQKELAADKTILEYQLSVAERYGDETRAAQIRAKLADVNNDLAKAQKDLSEAQEKAAMGLEGNSEASRENRAELLGIISSYKDYIKTLAELGRRPEQLAGDIDVLRRQFREQAIAAGYAEEQLAPYLELFDQFGQVATDAPRDVDIEVVLGIDAAEQAINEFLAKNRSMGVEVKLDDPDTRTYTQRLQDNLQGMLNNIPLDADTMWGRYLQDLINNIKNPTVTESPTRSALQGMWKNIAYDTQSMWGQYLMQALKAGSKQAILQTASSGMASVGGSISRRPAYPSYLYDYYRTMYLDALRLADGGLVEGPGSARSDSVPARLSKGEYVVQASAVQAYGVDFMNALNSQRIPMAASAPAAAAVSAGSTIAYLAPEDRALLRAVADRPVTLYADNTKIAQSANAGNQTLSQRGLK